MHERSPGRSKRRRWSEQCSTRYAVDFDLLQKAPSQPSPSFYSTSLGNETRDCNQTVILAFRFALKSRIKRWGNCKELDRFSSNICHGIFIVFHTRSLLIHSIILSSGFLVSFGLSLITISFLPGKRGGIEKDWKISCI